MLDKILKTIFFLSLGFVLFTGICAVLHFQYKKSTPLSGIFEGGEVWYTLKTKEDKFAPKGSKKLGLEITNHPKSGKKGRRAKRKKLERVSSKAYDGYTLVSARNLPNVYLIDMHQNIVHEWNIPFQKVWPHPTHINRSSESVRTIIRHAEMTPDGDLIAVYSETRDTPYGYGIAKVDKDSNVLWTYSENAHHEFYIDQTTGNIYALIHKFIHEPVKGMEDLHYPILQDFVTVLSPKGKEINRVSVLEAFRDSPYKSIMQKDTKRAKKWDLIHSNSVAKLEPSMAAKFPAFKEGQVLISMRNLSTIAVIDMDAKQVVWAQTGPWKKQHSARFTPQGTILVFDNTGLRSHQSRILEYDIQSNAITWSYMGGNDIRFFNKGYGAVDQLPNENRLVMDSYGGKIFEVTKNKDLVWRYDLSTHVQRIKRTIKKSKAGAGKVITMTAKRYSPTETKFLKKP
jgi:hypothetical protein